MRLTPDTLLTVVGGNVGYCEGEDDGAIVGSLLGRDVGIRVGTDIKFLKKGAPLRSCRNRAVSLSSIHR